LYSSDININLIDYSDADYAGDVTTRRSKSGLAFCVGKGLFAWSSQRQKSVSLSTTESEYIGLISQAVQELTWLMLLMSDLLETQEVKPIIYADNLYAIRLVKNPEFHKRSKHIDVRYHYIREQYEEGKFMLEYVRRDIMTKAIPRKQFEYLREKLGIQNNNS